MHLRPDVRPDMKRPRLLRLQGSALALLAAVVPLPGQTAPAVLVQLAPGTVLRIQVDHRSRIKAGNHVFGHLTEPIYVRDHLVIPAGATVSGLVRGSLPAPKGVRTDMLLAGDFSKPQLPDVTFDRLMLPAINGQPAQTIPIQVTTVVRNATVVRIGTPAKKVGLFGRAGLAIKAQRDSVHETLRNGKTEYLEKYVLNQLPFHPQMIWTGDGFDGTLAAPAELAETHVAALEVAPFTGPPPTTPLHARLVTSLTSATAIKGQVVSAIITQPLFTDDGKQLLVPEGTAVDGIVVQAEPARRYAHNGKLRFTFRHLQLGAAGTSPVDIHGHLAAAETAAGEHVSLDEEGEAQASGGPQKYVEPALLALLAISSAPHDHDHDGSAAGGVVRGNGFGLIARVLAATSPSRVTTEVFAGYAFSKSVYKNFLAKGHEVTFPADTRVQISLTER